MKFKIGGRLVYKSKIVYKSLNPTWDETFTYLLDDPMEAIQIKVWTVLVILSRNCIIESYCNEISRSVPKLS